LKKYLVDALNFRKRGNEIFGEVVLLRGERNRKPTFSAVDRSERGQGTSLCSLGSGRTNEAASVSLLFGHAHTREFFDISDIVLEEFVS